MPTWTALIALGLVAGLGGGALDGSINAYAATHFSPRAMNWLHACFGIGAALGPAMITTVLTVGASWRIGYALVAAAQLALAASFALMRRTRDRLVSAVGNEPVARSASLRATLRLPLAWLGIGLFFAFNGIGSATGTWVYSLLTEARGVMSVLEARRSVSSRLA